MIKRINAYELGKDREKDFRLFLLGFFLLLIYGVVCQLHIGWYKADSYVTSLLAFSYLKHGFVRRGLVGTLFDLLCRLIPSLMSYRGAVWFMWGVNMIYFTSLLTFVKRLLKKIGEREEYRGAFFFALVCFAFLIPSACVKNGALGRADLLQIVLCLLQIWLLIEMKHEWLTVPLTAVNVMFHEGYVLMTFCAVLIVIIYRALNTEENLARSRGIMESMGFGDSAWLITSDYHMWRASKIARGVGLTAIPSAAATPVASWLVQWCREVLVICFGA